MESKETREGEEDTVMTEEHEHFDWNFYSKYCLMHWMREMHMEFKTW